MEKQLSCQDGLVLGIRKGPFVLGQVLLEGITLSEIRLALVFKNPLQSTFNLGIQLKLLKTPLPIKEQQINIQILSQIKKSKKFFEILESQLELGETRNREIILDILLVIGPNPFYQELIEKHLTDQQLLFPEDNLVHSLVYLNYGICIFLK